MRIRSLLRAVLAAGLVAAPALAHAATLYSNDFSSNTNGFTGTTTLLPSAGAAGQFLGPLTLGDTATLTVNTAGYSSVTLNFDLYALNSLDGDGTSDCCGPDYFDLNVNGATSLLHATFANPSGWTQSYGGAGSPGGTGSDPALTGTLGYYEYFGPDHTYHLSFTTTVSGDSTAFNFIGNSNQGWSDEGFGLDNVTVTGDRVSAVPLPSSLPLFGTVVLALFGLAGRRTRSGLA